MKALNLTVSAFATVLFSTLVSSAAMAEDCGSGSIEVVYAGKETCVAPEQFATLSPEVQATADQSDVAEAMGQDDDSSGADDSSDDDSQDASNDGDSDNGSSGSGDSNDDDSGDSGSSGDGGSGDGGSGGGDDGGSDDD